MKNSYLYATNAVYIEDLYEKYLKNPDSVSQEWKNFFSENIASLQIPSWRKKQTRIIESDPEDADVKIIAKSTDNIPVQNSLEHLRNLGHLAASIDPLGIDIPKTLQELNISEKLDKLKIYTSNIGVEFSSVQNFSEQEWLYSRYEELFNLNFKDEEKKSFLKSLVEVEGLEQYIHKKFPGAKRFSVEGGESSILSLEEAIDTSAVLGVEEVVIGMAHRGRLNTLTKILGKPYEAVLGEFMGIYSFPKELGIAGDVKYHMGYSNDLVTKSGKKLHVTLNPNPSHLEAVNPVVAGRVRAKQDLLEDSARSKVMGLLIHGDAAFCGQGIVAESLAMSPLDAYDVGGIFHIVINNQVGFTANPRDGHKNSRYSTEFAKIIGAPVIHVNGDDVEAVIKSAKLLAEYRAKYKKDAVLEIICYRKYGHNEGDEPMYTQPQIYSKIKTKNSPLQLYADKLISEKIISKDIFANLIDEFKTFLDLKYEIAKNYKPKVDFLDKNWKGYSKDLTINDLKLKTGVEKSKLKNILASLIKTPEGFNINPKLVKLFDQRMEDFTKNSTLDWASAEQLAFATLLQDGFPIRITGQDAGRGTFSHRHSVLHDQKNGSKYLPLNNIPDNQAGYEVADSCLSEYGVMGFEFGYSMAHPKSLVIWEAQFGDFSNGAQIIFDQFLSTTETKWLRLSGLVLLLPHSYEGQGPEHTSARLERILQLCAEDNMQVAYPTTPASIFHLLRRQQLRQVRKPLIIMSPKSIFRNPLAISNISEIDEGTKFSRVIADNLDSKKIRRVIFCYGKIYYDLFEKREKLGINNIAIIRIEQLYPFPFEEISQEIAKYKNAEFVWCQEEPENMGAWSFFYSRILNKLDLKNVKLISRNEAASPATGYASVHNSEQENLIQEALSI